MPGSPPQASREIELCLRVPDAQVARLREAMKAAGAVPLRLRARYFDTPDSRLARHAVALRMRQEDSRWMQTLKARGASHFERLEHEVVLARHGDEGPELDIDLHEREAAGQALHEALGDDGAARLAERFGTDVTRWHCTQAFADGTRIEFALDEGRVQAGERSEPICEIELELKSGALDTLFDVALDGIARHGLWLVTASKAERGERLASGAAASAVRAGPVTLEAPRTGANFLRAVLAATLDAVLANATTVAGGSDDVECIHQLRVGIRRLRTAMRELHDLSDAIDPAWDAALAACFEQLGRRRDAETLDDAVRPLLSDANAPVTSWPASDAADTAAAVRDAGFQRALLSLLQLAHAGDERFAELSPARTRGHVAARLDRLWKRIARDTRRFESLPLGQQHRTRKRLKRLRYLAEFAAPLWSAKAAGRFVQGLEKAQDALGRHQDVSAAADRFREAAREDPRAWFAAGYLSAHLAVTARAARKALETATRIKAFW